MRQKNFLLVGSFVLTVAVAGSYHAYTSNSAVKQGDLLMANVEALAGASETGTTSWNCGAESSAGLFCNLYYM